MSDMGFTKAPEDDVNVAFELQSGDIVYSKIDCTENGLVDLVKAAKLGEQIGAKKFSCQLSNTPTTSNAVLHDDEDDDDYEEQIEESIRDPDILIYEYGESKSSIIDQIEEVRKTGKNISKVLAESKFNGELRDTIQKKIEYYT